MTDGDDSTDTPYMTKHTDTETPTMTILNTVNASNFGEWTAHKEGCRDIRRDLRWAGVFVEATGVTDLEAYMQTNYGYAAGYGDKPGDGWHAHHVDVKPCAR